MWLNIIELVVLALVSIELYFRFGRAGRLIRKIPGPNTLPLFGNLHNYFLPPDKLFLFQRSIFKQYGEINQLHMMNIRMVNVNNPEDIEKILSFSQANHKEHPYNYVKCWLGQGLLVSNGMKWTQRRKMLTKAFHFNILKNLFGIFEEETDIFLDRVQDEVAKQRTDLFPLMSSTTLRIMCETTMGSTSDDLISLKDEYLSSIKVFGECFTKRLGSVWLHPEPLYQLSNIAKKQNVAVEKLHSLTNSVIKSRRNHLAKGNFNYFDHDDSYEGNEKLAMLDLLLKNEKAGILDQQAVREEVDTFIFAGHDTTAVAMTFLIMALANEPEIQDKIFAEICQILGDRAPTTDDINQMKYLECCIKESLRLYPSVPMIARHLLKDIELGGYKVPANTAAFISIYDLHRRADLFPEPESFIPERFLPENCAKRHPYAYIPFSAGPRNCIGQKFAMMQMKTIMSKLLRKYRLVPITKPKDITYKTDMVLLSTHPICVKFCSRK